MRRPPAIGPERRWRPLVSIVLSVFMAGLAFGSWGGGRLARCLEASGAMVPLYATTEFIIGFSGLAVPRQLDWGGALLATAGTGVDWNSASYYIATGGWITLTLLPYAIGHVVAAPRDEKLVWCRPATEDWVAAIREVSESVGLMHRSARCR